MLRKRCYNKKKMVIRNKASLAQLKPVLIILIDKEIRKCLDKDKDEIEENLKEKQIKHGIINSMYQKF
jgi:hypothetical protein